MVYNNIYLFTRTLESSKKIVYRAIKTVSRKIRLFACIFFFVLLAQEKSYAKLYNLGKVNKTRLRNMRIIIYVILNKNLVINNNVFESVC